MFPTTQPGRKPPGCPIPAASPHEWDANSPYGRSPFSPRPYRRQPPTNPILNKPNNFPVAHSLTPNS